MPELNEADQRAYIAEYHESNNPLSMDPNALVDAAISEYGGIDARLLLGISGNDEVQRLGEKYSLTATQQEIVTGWLEEGVRSNSIAWFEMTKKFFPDMGTKDPAKHLATLLFIDTFNRADSVFDEKSDVYCS